MNAFDRMKADLLCDGSIDGRIAAELHRGHVFALQAKIQEYQSRLESADGAAEQGRILGEAICYLVAEALEKSSAAAGFAGYAAKLKDDLNVALAQLAASRSASIL